MEVILREDVEKLGKAGDKVRVKDGYARNFLFVRALALPATDKNLKVVDEEKKKKLAIYEKRLDEAKVLADKITKASCTVAVKVGENDKLYGSVTAQDVASALEAEGISVDKKKIEFDQPVQALGVYYARVRLHQDVSPTLKVWVVKE